MTPKQKAEELIEKFQKVEIQRNRAYKSIGFRAAKQGALIAANEIFSLAVALKDFTEVETISIVYWENVKNELKLL